MSYNCLDPIQYAEKELELSGFMATDFGKAALEFIKQTYNMANNDMAAVRLIYANIAALVDLNPLAPLLEEEMEEQETLDYANGGLVKIMRKQHKRCPWVYEKDGKYWDDRAVAFQNKDGGIWYGQNGNHRSKREITFPYYRREQLVYIGEIDTSVPGNQGGTAPQ